MSLFTSWLASAPPDAAIAITPDAVCAAVLGGRGGDAAVQAFASEPLPAGAVTASLTSHNVIDHAATVRALGTVLGRLPARPRRAALVIPDLTGRVSLIRFDRIPARREDLDQLVRWQARKASPFPVEDASLSYTPGARTADGGGELVVVLARREAVREYERVCEEHAVEAGLVDLETLSIVNLFLAGAETPRGDWLAVHLRPECSSIAIMRDANLIFFRSRPEGDEGTVSDLVHQTTMYYQDRLEGRGFARVFVGGSGQRPGAVDLARRGLDERLGVRSEAIEPGRAGGAVAGAGHTPDTLARMAPLVGILMRTRVAAGVV